MIRIPDDLQDRYAAWRWEKAYEWVDGRPTFRLTAGSGEVRYLTVHPVGTGIPDEATRLRWAAQWVRAPRLIEYGSDGFRDWLMTAELSGVDAARHVFLSGTEPAGYLDFGAIGVADRWLDLAIGLRSLDHNLGTGFQDDYLAGYGLALDEAKRTAWLARYDAARPG